MGKVLGKFSSPAFLQCLVTTPRLSLMVGHALGDHFVLRSVESVRVLPDGFALADAGVATHVRRIVLWDHTIDQKLAFTGAVVYRRSGAKIPAHGGLGISEIGAGGNDRVGGPFLDVGGERRLGVAGGCVFPSVYLASGEISVGSVGDLGAQVEGAAGVERLVTAVVHAGNPGAGGDHHVIEKVCQAVLGERVRDGRAAAAGALSAESCGAVFVVDVVEYILEDGGAAAGGAFQADAAGILPIGGPGELHHAEPITYVSAAKAA